MKLLIALVRILPLWWLRALGFCFGWVLLNQRTKSIIMRNLTLAYPHMSTRARQKLARHAFVGQMMTALETLKIWVMPPSYTLKKISAQGQKTFLNALNDKKGVLVVIAHLGTWEAINAWVSQYCAPVIMYKPLKSMDTLVKNARQKTGAKLVPTDTSGVKSMLSALKSGGVALVLPDHVPRTGIECAPFFGLSTPTSTLATRLAQKTGCAVVSMRCVRTVSGFLLDIEPMNATTPAAINLGIEDMINLDPKHYLWSYKRFKGIFGEDVYAMSDEKFYATAAKHIQNNENTHG